MLFTQFSITVTVCEGNPCRNSAVCVDNGDGNFTCECQANYEGILCEKKGNTACMYISPIKFNYLYIARPIDCT